MGEYFYYINHDKRQLFDIGLNAYNIKFSGIGWNGIATRAFCLIMTQSSHDRYSHTLIGSWIGDRVTISGDYSKWDQEFDAYQNITANMIQMLYQIDGGEILIEAANTNDYLFLQIGYLIFSNQFTAIASEFNQSFGDNWSRKYKQLLEKYPYSRFYDLIKLS
ncbi:MAG: hypothetical protein AAF383_10655 [Cyanobacteria bacterium P01_A01_bin.83]